MKLFKGNKNLAIIALIAVVNALGYGIIIPVVYTYSEQFGLNTLQYGLLFATFSLCQFISTPIIGRLSDKFGRRPLLIISLVGTAISFFMMAFAPSAIFLFIARALDGITAGNIPVAMAVISDTTEEKDRAQGFGIIGASFGFGFIFGPAISGLTVGIWSALPFIIAGIITIIAVLLTMRFLPETNIHMGEVRHSKLFDLPKLVSSLVDPAIGLTLIINFIYSIAFGLFIAVFQLFSSKSLGLDNAQIAFVYMLYGIVGLIMQVLLVGKITNKFGVKKTFTVSIFFSGLAFFGMFISTNIPVFLFFSVMLGMANSLVNSLIPTILSQETDPKSQGTVMGLNTSYMSIGQIIGPILGGAIAGIGAGYPFLVASLFVAMCYFFSFHVLKPGIKRESAF